MDPNLKLKLNDWRWATWRDIPPEPWPEPKAFDLDAALKKVEKSKKRYYTVSDYKLHHTITRQEAHFWLEVIATTSKNWYLDSAKLAKELASDNLARRYHGEISLTDVQQMLTTHHRYGLSNLAIVPVLYTLLDRATFIRALSELQIKHYGVDPDPVTQGFRAYILPHLTSEDRDEYRALMRPYLVNWQDQTSLAPLAAALGGMDTEIEAWLSDPHLRSASVQRVVFGLSNPQRVEEIVRHHRYPYWGAEYLKAWIAHTETNALDFVGDLVKDARGRTDAQKKLRFFNKLPVPQSVLPVLRLWQDSKVPGEALQWLLNHPEIVAQTILPLALGSGDDAKLAKKYVQRMIGSGQIAHIEAALQGLNADDQARVGALLATSQASNIPPLDEDSTPAWLAEAAATMIEGKPSKKITWVNLLELPPLTVEGQRLNNHHITAVLTAMSKETERRPDGLLAALRQHIAPAERDAFVWAIYEMWQDHGSPSKNSWALKSMGLLGGDGVVMKLTPLIRKWPGESQHQRAVSGLDVLRQIGTDTALMSINGIAQKVKYQGIKKRAHDAMKAIADELGLTKAALEDRIIPDCGLDENGQRVFDYGPRQFTFVLSSEMKPMVRDQAGKRLAKPPKPGKRDDAALAPQAEADWKLIKKQIQAVAKVQATRLENAMIAQRRWTPADFQQFYVDHPLMIHIVRLLLWGAYDADGALLSAFRVSEDRDWVDVEDEPIRTESVASVGVLHAMEINLTSQQEWGEVLSDYEIIPPFPQLSRQVSHLEADEGDKKEITRFAQYKVQPVVLVSILEKSGWQRGPAMDGGWYNSHAKYYETANVTAVVRYDGAAMGFWDVNEQGIDSCFFVEGDKEPEGYRAYAEEAMLRLGDVSPVVISETLRTLHAIAKEAQN